MKPLQNILVETLPLTPHSRLGKVPSLTFLKPQHAELHLPFQTEVPVACKATRHPNILFLDKRAQVAAAEEYARSFQPRACACLTQLLPCSKRKANAGLACSPMSKTTLLTREKMQGIACTPADIAGHQGKNILEVRIICRCYKQ